MGSGFVFEVPSDEEPEYDLHSEEDEDGDDELEGSQSPKKTKLKSQSPWDFAKFSQAVAEEHARRNTTSVDDKISKLRQQCSLSLPLNDDSEDDSDDSSDSEPHRQASLEKDKSPGNEVISAEKAEELKMKEKRKREREKKLPRKKRRKLEAAREMLEEEDDSYDSEEDTKKGKKDKSGIPLVDVAYRRAKAVKAGKKAQESGKKLKKVGKQDRQTPSRTEEMQDLFQADMSVRRQKKTVQRSGKSKNSFKSKSRYKRRK